MIRPPTPQELREAAFARGDALKLLIEAFEAWLKGCDGITLERAKGTGGELVKIQMGREQVYNITLSDMVRPRALNNVCEILEGMIMKSLNISKEKISDHPNIPAKLVASLNATRKLGYDGLSIG